ncbi:hypothetical protein FZEAL_5107 [Fusarium zealandicum]|uniref:Rhodopsin domain-containing protein n=1 Tax=Fusarium zealandicum TaxID=1053134 RepID=A0A8H4UKE0_9HYPO|nr:hypothetical protein FZEAL_5107 [Fusarium zealandicum]
MDPSQTVDAESETRAPVMIAVAIVLMSLSSLMVGLRLWCRKIANSFGLDDLAAVMTLISILGCGSAMIAMTKYGLGRHEWTLSTDAFVLYQRCFWVSVLFYMMALFWAKMAFLLNYYRIMSVSNMRNVVLGSIVLVGLWGGSQFIMRFVQCIPLKAVWDPRVEAKCIPNETALWYINGVINIVSDIAILVLPLPVVWKLNLPRGQKLILSGIFGLGFFTVAVSIMRMQWLTPQKDVTWWNVTAASWSLSEITSAITCACLPTLKPLVARYEAKVNANAKRDNTFRLQSVVVDADTESSMTVDGSQDRSSSETKKPEKLRYGIVTRITAK